MAAPAAISSTRTPGAGGSRGTGGEAGDPGAAPARGRARLSGRLAAAAGDIKLAHSVFAMPFAILAAFLSLPVSGGGVGGEGGERVSVLPGAASLAVTLALIVGCMVSARTFAMLVNRWADRRIDALNPRTARRALPAGAMTGADALWFASGAAAVFVVLCAGFWVRGEGGVGGGNPWPLILSVPVLGWLGLYSFTKRFTFACHFFLGSSLAMSPLAAALAIRPESLDPWASPGSIWLLSAMLAAWVAGFDAIYALQDAEFDRAHSVRSIPARFGAGATIRVARVLHGAALAALVLALWSDERLGWVFGVGVGVVGVMLVGEHVVLARRGARGLHPALFTLNGVVSCVVGAMGVIDALV